jgi:UDP-N-acetylglucosamine 4-epimerase
VVQANIKAALCQNSQVYWDVFNIGCGTRTTLLDLYGLLKRELGLGDEVQPLYRETRSGDITHSVANIDKARNLIGYAPRYSLEEGLKLTIPSVS